MTDYSKLSDFEVNSAVHNALLKEPYSLVFMGDDRIAWTEENGKQIITDKVPYTKNGVHDYCNNPTDAWPIVVDNNISVYAIGNNDKRGKWGAEGFNYNSPYHFHNNPLRAAMVVFLMMQDSSHANS